MIDMLKRFIKALNIKRPELAAKNKWFFTGTTPLCTKLAPLPIFWHKRASRGSSTYHIALICLLLTSWCFPR